MIKIIQFAFQSGLGGGQRIIFNIVNGLKNEVKFVIILPTGIFFKKYSQMGTSIKELKKVSPLETIKEIRNFIRKETPDIIHVHGTRAAFWLRISLIQFKSRPKIVYTLHGFHIIRRSFLKRWFLLRIEKFLNQWIDVLVCVSESDKNLVLKHKAISENKIVVIKNGIDISKFHVSEESVRTEKDKLGLSNSFVLTSIGRLHIQKDFSTLLRALKLIIFQIKNAKLLIVGDGALRESLEREVKKLELEQYVKFLGFREDVSILINFSDIIILSTKWEGLPLVPLEAGACKKPIIVSNVDGVREAIIDRETGYLFHKGSAQDLADKILKLYFSKELRDKLGKNGYNFVSKNFNKEKMTSNYFSLYKNLIKENIN